MALASGPTKPRKELGGASFYQIANGTYSFKKYIEYTGAVVLKGFQLRYIYFIDKRYRKKLTCPEIPFSRIDELGAGMYRGEKITRAERHNMMTE